ncbi:MAG: hypothetical protein JWP62_1150 [Blastococcus sp.]|jgi:hypothetical protein|nr:hypothetical protein [Blastococcus sp.]
MTETGTRTSRAPELTRTGALALLGALAGISAKAADESGWRWAADLGSYPAARVLAVALLGRFAPTWRAAALVTAVPATALAARGRHGGPGCSRAPCSAARSPISWAGRCRPRSSSPWALWLSDLLRQVP